MQQRWDLCDCWNKNDLCCLALWWKSRSPALRNRCRFGNIFFSRIVWKSHFLDPILSFNFPCYLRCKKAFKKIEMGLLFEPQCLFFPTVSPENDDMTRVETRGTSSLAFSSTLFILYQTHRWWAINDKELRFCCHRRCRECFSLRWCNNGQFQCTTSTHFIFCLARKSFSSSKSSINWSVIIIESSFISLQCSFASPATVFRVVRVVSHRKIRDKEKEPTEFGLPFDENPRHWRTPARRNWTLVFDSQKNTSSNREISRFRKTTWRCQSSSARQVSRSKMFLFHWFYYWHPHGSHDQWF